MPRNQYPGPCYRCNRMVGAGAGHYERHRGDWRVQHADCAIAYRGKSHVVGTGLPAGERQAATIAARAEAKRIARANHGFRDFTCLGCQTVHTTLTPTQKRCRPCGQARQQAKDEDRLAAYDAAIARVHEPSETL
jgi:hypothetical protein